MSDSSSVLQDEILRLYREPIVGANYGNTYGEENLMNLVKMYRDLNDQDMKTMSDLLVEYSQSFDLSSSYISVGVLHALEMNDQVEDAYRWAETQEDSQLISSHFDIGKSLADHFIPKK